MQVLSIKVTWFFPGPKTYQRLQTDSSGLLPPRDNETWLIAPSLRVCDIIPLHSKPELDCQNLVNWFQQHNPLSFIASFYIFNEPENVNIRDLQRQSIICDLYR